MLTTSAAETKPAKAINAPRYRKNVFIVLRVSLFVIQQREHQRVVIRWSADLDLLFVTARFLTVFFLFCYGPVNKKGFGRARRNEGRRGNSNISLKPHPRMGCSSTRQGEYCDG